MCPSRLRSTRGRHAYPIATPLALLAAAAATAMAALAALAAGCCLATWVQMKESTIASKIGSPSEPTSMFIPLPEDRVFLCALATSSLVSLSRSYTPAYFVQRAMSTFALSYGLTLHTWFELFHSYAFPLCAMNVRVLKISPEQ